MQHLGEEYRHIADKIVRTLLRNTRHLKDMNKGFILVAQHRLEASQQRGVMYRLRMPTIISGSAAAKKETIPDRPDPSTSK